MGKGTLTIETKSTGAYVLIEADINRVGEYLRRKFGGEKGLLREIRRINQLNSRKHKASFHQNKFTCEPCIHSLALTKREKSGGCTVRCAEEVGCNYRDSLIVSLSPPPPVQTHCEWLGFYRLALNSGLLELFRK